MHHVYNAHISIKILLMLTVITFKLKCTYMVLNILFIIFPLRDRDLFEHFQIKNEEAIKYKQIFTNFLVSLYTIFHSTKMFCC